MNNGPTHNLTPEARAFLEPRNATHRQYEALRAYFVDEEPSADVAQRFGYTPGSFRVLCHEFRKNLDREFFCPTRKRQEPSKAADPVRQKMIALRKQNLSIYDIQAALEEEGIKRSSSTIAAVLQEEGFARLPRRRDEERPA